MNTCRKCGKEIKKSDLRCSKCRKYVDMEIKYGYINKPLAFYFSNYYMYWYPKKK